MRGAGLLAFSAASVVRARRRSAFVLVGLALAVATVATPVLALDSELQALVTRLLETIPYDFHATGRTWEHENASYLASSVAGIAAAEPALITQTGGLKAGVQGTNATTIVRDAFGVAVVRPSFAAFSDRFGYSGSLDLAPGEVAVTDRLAGRLALDAGGTIHLWNQIELCSGRPPECAVVNLTANYTIGAVLTTPVGAVVSPLFQRYALPIPHGEVLFIGFDSLATMPAEIGIQVADPPGLTLFIWADRARLVRSYDPEATDLNVRRTRQALSVALLPYQMSVSDASSPTTGASVAGAVRSVNDATVPQLGLFLALSLPTAALALLFARIGVEASLARRRREIGVLRSRGFRTRDVLAYLLIEAALLGGIAALLGFGIAVIVSRVFLGYASASFAGGLPIAFADVPVYPGSIGITILAAVLAAFLVAYPAVRRSTSMRIVHALRHVSSLETSVDPRIAGAIGTIALGCIGLASIVGFQGVDPRAGFVPFFLDAVRAILILLAPVLLIVGTTRIVTLGSARPYRTFARIVRPWTGDLHVLVAEGLRRNPRRSSRLASIVAFGLAFGIFVVALLGIVEASEVRAARTLVGADVTLTGTRLDRFDLELFRFRPDVDRVAVADYIPTNFGVAIALDADEYMQAVPWLDAYYFLEGAPSAVRDLRASRGAIPDERLAASQGLRVGDRIVINIFSGRVLFPIVVPVVAIVTTLPGLGHEAIDLNKPGFVVFDVTLLAAEGVDTYPIEEPGRRAILRVAPGADPHEVAKAFEDAFDGDAVVYDDVLASARSDPFRASLFGHLYTQAGLAAFVLVLAVSLTAYASGVEREGEFATIAARGLGGGGLAALLFGEGLAVSLVGALLAVPIVLVSLLVFLQFLAALPGVAAMEFLIPVSAWSLLVGALGAAALGTALAGLRLRRMDLPAVLKVRGM